MPKKKSIPTLTVDKQKQNEEAIMALKTTVGRIVFCSTNGCKAYVRGECAILNKRVTWQSVCELDSEPPIHER